MPGLRCAAPSWRPGVRRSGGGRSPWSYGRSSGSAVTGPPGPSPRSRSRVIPGIPPTTSVSTSPAPRPCRDRRHPRRPRRPDRTMAGHRPRRVDPHRGPTALRPGVRQPLLARSGAPAGLRPPRHHPPRPARRLRPVPARPAARGGPRGPRPAVRAQAAGRTGLGQRRHHRHPLPGVLHPRHAAAPGDLAPLVLRTGRIRPRPHLAAGHPHRTAPDRERRPGGVRTPRRPGVRGGQGPPVGQAPHPGGTSGRGRRLQHPPAGADHRRPQAGPGPLPQHHPGPPPGPLPAPARTGRGPGRRAVGRVRLTVLHEDLFLPNILERDQALRPPTDHWPTDGVANIRPLQITSSSPEGLY